MGETRVDLLHLLEDLADAYPGDLEETVLTEIVANALDSGASLITLGADTTASTLTVIDNGIGMRRADLRRFHDVAASAKTRGEAIGFAGVGIKLGLLVSAEVVTESRRGKEHVATTWALVRRQRAPWRWITPAGLVDGRGTAVSLRLENPLSPLLDSGFVETTLRDHFEPLFDPAFDEILREHYPHGVRFEIAGRMLSRRAADSHGDNVAPISVRLARKRKPSAVGYLVRAAETVRENRQGVAISTYGKVIKRGWDWLGLSPAMAARVTGLIEAPALAASLTLNKVDFLRSGPRGATYMAYRKVLQEAISHQLTAWTDQVGDPEETHRRATRPVERDVEEILAGLTDRFPMLAMLVDRRPGGNRRVPGGGGAGGDVPLPPDDLFAPVEGEEPMAPAHIETGGDSSRDTGERPTVSPQTGGKSRRPQRLGLTIQFETRADLAGLGRLVESTVWVNDAHPAYTRAAASRAEGYHVALSVAMALAEVAAEPAQSGAFVTEFLARWGESSRQRAKRSRRKMRVR